MADRPKRKKLYIKKEFQTDFSIKFLILIAMESVLAIGLFIYLSRGTFITGYSGAELVIARTGAYFLPTVLLANLALIGVTAVAGFIIMLAYSHKIAGPLYRFEKSIDEMASGDLTSRFNLRANDQLEELAGKMNVLSEKLDEAVTGIKSEAKELEGALEEARECLRSGSCDTAMLEKKLSKASENLEKLKRSAGYFRTSGRKG
ncbi:MAG: methyl-accepting chemotaxis protein [Deltaproteobacteria bacterium]|nr:methyl-accepting chemotaxis protein [Deltaproteobacteria bacterium]